jgi:hypothetical protein
VEAEAELADMGGPEGPLKPAAVDDLLRHPDDQPSIGIILCKSKNKVVAEYALRDLQKPVGVSEYPVTCELPKQFRNGLPTIEELELRLKEETPT